MSNINNIPKRLINSLRKEYEDLTFGEEHTIDIKVKDTIASSIRICWIEDDYARIVDEYIPEQYDLLNIKEKVYSKGDKLVKQFNKLIKAFNDKLKDIATRYDIDWHELFNFISEE